MFRLQKNKLVVIITLREKQLIAVLSCIRTIGFAALKNIESLICGCRRSVGFADDCDKSQLNYGIITLREKQPFLYEEGDLCRLNMSLKIFR